MYADSMHAPFYHGIASGDPLPDAVIIWTRITPTNTELGDTLTVSWEMALDDQFNSPVIAGEYPTDSTSDFTVKIDVTGLDPGQTYYYRFWDESGNYSVTGRTKTVPITGVDSLKFAVASCSHIFHGYFNAYRAIAARENLNAVIHLGDFIYNNDGNNAPIRIPDPPPTSVNNTSSKNDWRARHAYYRVDPDFRLMLQSHPLIVVWDNHDIHNSNYTPAMEVWLEWVPVRENPNDWKRLYRKIQYGDLVDLFMLDIRPYKDIDTLGNGQFSFLGNDQYNWFTQELLNSTAQWKVVGNQKNFAHISVEGIGQLIGIEDSVYSTSTWDGYPLARKRLIDFIDQNSIDNILMLSGDAHIAIVTEVTSNPFDSTAYIPETGEGSVAVEFLPTSITSQNLDERGLPLFLEDYITDLVKAVNVHQRHLNLVRHGYGTIDVYRDSVEAHVWFLDQTEVVPIDSQEHEGPFVLLDGDNHWKRNPTPTASYDLLPPNTSVSLLYPNPVSPSLPSQLDITSSESRTLTMSVQDLAGRTVLPSSTHRIPAGHSRLSVDASGLASGLYWLKLRGDGLRVGRWLVK